MRARPACGPWSSTSGARVADVAYRELTQYFPRPGWVEHDPDEIWGAVRATLAEVGARLAESGETRGGHRHHQPARDAGRLRPRERAAAAHAIVWQDRRTAPLCAELIEAGHLPLVRATTGLVLDPYFSATKAAWLLRHGDLALGAGRPEPLVLHRRHVGAVEPHRRHRRRRLRHRPLQRQPHVALRYRARSPGPPSCATSSACPRTRSPRCAPRPAASAPPRWATSAPPRPRSTASRSRGCSATSRRRSSARPASTPAWSRSPTAPAASCWPTPGPSARPRPTA